MPDVTDWIRVVRSSHDRLTALLAPLSPAEIGAPSYSSGWSIADVASHLGSQAEIFDLGLTAGLAGDPAAGSEVFGPIWARWNALAPTEQVAQSIAANEAFVARLEQTTPAERDAFTLDLFGATADLAGLAAMRLGEHALHTWDVAVMLDPAATVAPDATELLIGRVGANAARTSTPVDFVATVALDTTGPARSFLLTASPEVSLVDRDPGPIDDVLTLPAEALLRLVAGRLDPAHTPPEVTGDARLPGLRLVFPGY